jgi:hypothetical protein
VYAAEAKDQQELITPLPSLPPLSVSLVAAVRAIACDMLSHREDRAVQHRRCGPCTYPHLRALMVTTSDKTGTTSCANLQLNLYISEQNETRRFQLHFKN